MDKNEIYLFYRLLPGDIPSLGQRLRNAILQGESLDEYLVQRGEKVYKTVDDAVLKMLQVVK